MKNKCGRPAVKMIGKKFGSWYVAGNASKKTSSGILYYRCECDCGNIREIQGSALRNGMSKGCMDCGGKKIGAKLTGRKSFNRLPDGEAQRNAIYLAYKRGSARRKLSFSISRDFFSKITKMDCFYCGKKPSQNFKNIYNSGLYIYNGIDRVNNDIGYEENNCVPCCKFCNRAKDTLSQDEFLKNIKRIYKYIMEVRK